MSLGWLRLAGVLISLLLMVAILAPVQILVLKFAPGRGRALPRFFHRSILAMLRIRRSIEGTPAASGALYVSNHTSWTDIPLLGAELDGLFVAKSEVGSWPLLGALARLDGVLFVDRDRAQRAGGQAAAIAGQLGNGDSVILFPEGTTDDGGTMLPFKTSLFAAAGEADGIVQPVTLAYTRVGRRPTTPDERRSIAWLGDEPLLPHALRLLSMPPLTGAMIFHPPARRSDFADRKALARHCEQVIAAGLARLTA